jgi:hypothetical protein
MYGAEQPGPPIGKLPERTVGYFVARVLLGIASFGGSEFTYTAMERERFLRTPKSERVRYSTYKPKTRGPATVTLTAEQVARATQGPAPMPILDAQTGEIVGQITGEVEPAPAPTWPWVVGGLVVGGAGLYYWNRRKKGARR